MATFSEYAPDLGALVQCAALAATAMGMHPAPNADAEAFMRSLVHADRSDAGRHVVTSLQTGLITEAEARDLVMAHVATWISRLNGAPEPPRDLWSSPELELRFAMALLGRPPRCER